MLALGRWLVGRGPPGRRRGLAPRGRSKRILVGRALIGDPLSGMAGNHGRRERCPGRALSQGPSVSAGPRIRRLGVARKGWRSPGCDLPTRHRARNRFPSAPGRGLGEGTRGPGIGEAGRTPGAPPQNSWFSGLDSARGWPVPGPLESSGWAGPPRVRGPEPHHGRSEAGILDAQSPSRPGGPRGPPPLRGEGGGRPESGPANQWEGTAARRPRDDASRAVTWCVPNTGRLLPPTPARRGLARKPLG